MKSKFIRESFLNKDNCPYFYTYKVSLHEDFVSCNVTELSKDEEKIIWRDLENQLEGYLLQKKDTEKMVVNFFKSN
jgi:outer membrane lipopolysaccharide assembly protein LptE/RlpB